jgi:hypothetical protein
MFKEFAVKNFRCFGNLEIGDLARVNLIAGKNNTGKTALLEAIRLHCDPTDSRLPTKLNESRGFENLDEVFAEAWAWCFRDRDLSRWLELVSKNDQGKNHAVKMRLTDVETARAGLNGVPESPANFPGQGWHGKSPCLVIEHEGPGGQKRFVWVIGAQGEAWYTPKEAWRVPCELVASGTPSSNSAVGLFSALETEKRLGEILPSVQVLEPRLQRLSLAVLGQKSVIHGDVGLSRLIPITLMGEGVRRLLSLLLAIVTVKGGVVLIDEIENGFHYSVQKKVWEAIAVAARQNSVQIFATTHSWECLVRAHEAFAESEDYDFRWIRLQDVRGQIEAVGHDREMIESAIYNGVEVR